MPDLKVQPLERFNGYGLGLTLGEHFYSQNLRRSRAGVKAGWHTETHAFSAPFDPEDSGIGKLTTLPLIKAFAQAKFGSETKIYGYGVGNGVPGTIHSSDNGVGAWELAHTFGSGYYGNGMITDQKGRLIYVGKRFVGMYDGTWHDAYQDFGDDLKDIMQPLGLALLGDAVIIPHTSATGSSFGALYTADQPGGVILEESFTPRAFDVPNGFTAVTARNGRSGVLLGCNFQERGVLILWDGYSNKSISPWIYLNGTLQAIVPYNGDWLVITNKEILSSNGYTATFLAHRPDVPFDEESFTVMPNGAEIIGSQYLVIANSAGKYNRARAGLEAYDLTANAWNYITLPKGTYSAPEQYELQMGAILTGTDVGRTHFAHGNSNGQQYISTLFFSRPSKAVFIVEAGQLSQNRKDALAARIKLSCDDEDDQNEGTMSLEVSAKIYNFKRPLWTYGITTAGDAGEYGLRVDETQATVARAQVGDMVWMLDGQNAGEIRHIASKENPGTAAAVWIMDVPFHHITDTSAKFVRCPFEKISTKTITSVAQLDDVFFSIKNKVRGKKFLLMFLLENIEGMTPDINGADLFYFDAGIL